MIIHVSSTRTGLFPIARISYSDFRAFVFRAFVDWRIGVFQVEQKPKRFIYGVLNVNNHNDGRTGKRSFDDREFFHLSTIGKRVLVP